MSEYIDYHMGDYLGEYILDIRDDDSGLIKEKIVRCRDCRHRAGDEAEEDGIDPYLCFVHEEYMAPDYFCADGERRVEE